LLGFRFHLKWMSGIVVFPLMKEPLLSLEPAPESAGQSEEHPGLPAPSPRLHLPGAHPHPLPAHDSLLDPAHFADPVAPVRRKPAQIPVSWVILTFSSLTLLLAGLLLGMRISDYQHGRYFEKRFGKLFDVPDTAHEPMLVEPATSRSPIASASVPSPSGPVIDSSPAPARPSLPDAGHQASAWSTPPVSGNSDFDGELAALRQERQMVSQRFEQLNSSRTNPALASAGRSQTGAALADLPAAPPVPDLTPEQLQIRDAPAIARVREYDPDWHFVVLDGGKERNLTEGTQLAIRRGHELLGLIRVDEVLERESVAELQGPWRADSQAPKPRRGDDAVTYPPF
jgi:hypothetical protein